MPTRIPLDRAGTNLPRVLLLLAVAGLAGCSSRVATREPHLSRITQIAYNGQRVEHCRQCVAGANTLIFDSNGANERCSTGGAAFHLWSSASDGSNKIDLTATKRALGNITSLNEGNPKFSPDGKWIIFQAQANNSTIACNNDAVNPGAGFDEDAYIAPYPALDKVYKMTDIRVGLGKGTLHPVLLQNWMYWMNITGIGGGVGNITGTLAYAPFSIVNGVPTLGAVTECTSGSCGLPAGNKPWYETTGYDPHFTDRIFFTTGFTYPTVQVWGFDLSRGASVGAVSNTNGETYTEFWNCDESGRFAVTMSTEGTPLVPTTKLAGSDLMLATCGSGLERVQLTSYNVPGSPMYLEGTGIVSHPVFGPGPKIYWTLQQPGKVSLIFMADFNN